MHYELPPKPPKLPTTHDLQGNVITINNLPPSETRRWTPNKKAIVVRAVRHGLVSLRDVLDRYDMTEHEFLIWQQGLHEDKVNGLKVTHYQKRRTK